MKTLKKALILLVALVFLLTGCASAVKKRK